MENPQDKKGLKTTYAYPRYYTYMVITWDVIDIPILNYLPLKQLKPASLGPLNTTV